MEHKPGPLLERDKSMANEEQLSILKQGFEVWNKWRNKRRKKKSRVMIDLSEVDLMKSDLHWIDLSGANLRNSKLNEVNLTGANLTKADLTGADLRQATLIGANLTGADLTETTLARADLTGADLSGANLRHVDFTEANMEWVNLTGASLLEVNITGANLKPIQNLTSVSAAGGLAAVIAIPEGTSFTAIYPKECKIETWHTLLVYAHLLSVVQDVRQDAQRFKDQFPTRKETNSSSFTKIIRGTELTIVPSCDGLVFNPERVVLKWLEDYHRADFRFRADKSLANDAARGQIAIYAGPIIVGTLRLAMLLNEADSQVPVENEEHSSMYHKEDIFVSYSHKDSNVVLACQKAYKALGFNVFIDIDTLRAGQVWNEELMKMIDNATIFQLFWSQNSSKSQYCQQEWQHALKWNKEGFIRPVYWEFPMPEPPEELSRYHFDYIQF